MSYRAVSAFWNGPDLYERGDEVSLPDGLIEVLVRAGKVEKVALDSAPAPAPAPGPGPSKSGPAPSRPTGSTKRASGRVEPPSTNPTTEVSP